jgi:hypothetical protein
MNFALITEGPSEHRIIKHIIAKYFKDQEPEINQIQPKIINEKQETVGGWNEVLKYCERDEVKDIFVENDYLVIQIDTDQSQTKPFGISHTKQDAATKVIVNKTVGDLHAEVVEKLRSLIRPEILAVYGDRIFFAICVHTIECWLLPLHFAEHHQSSTNNCLKILNINLRKRNIDQIPAKNKNSPQSIRTYETILRDWRKRADIVQSAKHNLAFQKFVDSLGNIPFPSEVGDH